MGARRLRGSRSLIWGRWLQGHQPVQGKTALRVAMMARSTGWEGCSQTRTARTPRVSPRSSARVRSGRCAARRTPATGRGSAFRGRSAGPRLRRAGASRSAAPPGPGHTGHRRSAASARRSADPGRAHHSAGRIALPPQFTKPQPNQRKPSRTQTTAALLSRLIASFGLTWPAPAGDFGSRGGNRPGSTVGAVLVLDFTRRGRHGWLRRVAA
jgi:hypothetical protein